MFHDLFNQPPLNDSNNENNEQQEPDILAKNKQSTTHKRAPAKKANNPEAEQLSPPAAKQPTTQKPLFAPIQNTNYLAELNEVQRAAVTTLKGPVMIIAGPGSGKTRVLTYRMVHLINSQIAPWNILSLTFTNKAAREMKRRIASLTNNEASRQLNMGTFHSIFARLLRIEAEALGYPANFTIYDPEDAKSLITAIVKELKLDDKEQYNANSIYHRISFAKNKLILPTDYNKNTQLQQYDNATKRPHLGLVYDLYVKRCKQAGAMDFDDLLVNMFVLFQTNPEILAKYQQKFSHIMVDEFQDTNYVQYTILRMLAAQHRNLCIVGDDAQSIYAFRGATIDNILHFEKDYPERKLFKLEQNYRSTKHIVQISNDIIARNANQLAKTVWTDNDIGSKPRVINAASDNDEGRLIADSIAEERLRNHYKNEQIAILYRTNAQSRTLEEALRRKGIPYRIYGGLSFFQRKEIKDMMAYLRLVANQHDEEALRRVINYPLRGIGTTTLDKLWETAAQLKISVWDAATQITRITSITAKAQNAIAQFIDMVRYLQLLSPTVDAYELAVKAGEKSGLIRELHQDKTVEGLSRYENLQELFNSIKEFVDNRKAGVINEASETVDSSLGAYLQEVSLYTDLDNENDEQDKVKLMTVHTAKGLEFECVFIAGLEEQLFPSRQSSEQPSQLEEERRLFYVAVTRAQKKLYLCNAANRYRFGQLQDCQPSRFLSEIPPESLDIIGGGIRKPSFVTTNPAYDGFQNSISSNIRLAQKQQQQKNSVAGTNVNKGNLTNLPQIENFKPSPANAIILGVKVAHQRFGYGKVTALEGEFDKRIAHIDFQHHGEKRMMLKFAQLMVVPDKSS
ncbi:MAG: UvrD-helicase domain-containing protein [Sphingobacteriales bacterium]|jgi:DNA helicase-2/ATP-dependent DNA helicase PcrA|nr:UvrD-helicase domain-containing protein [Sphingobacteriales bacterium]MBP9142779.1 UvrD-helicase domain-containing protein [Chitinophagales bacterium]MBK6890982.1 UvrD-helicase domain-containing protein [Sphingobacteriales bacterium]MBK7525967.1 UvrD-helicase domain-containing protein [Sphingobacteriales bacterium]MBK8677682.1 UvrD-helicase domain-containing protein [Sphingobacteriales bacterium]